MVDSGRHAIPFYKTVSRGATPPSPPSFTHTRPCTPLAVNYYSAVAARPPAAHAQRARAPTMMWRLTMLLLAMIQPPLTRFAGCSLAGHDSCSHPPGCWCAGNPLVSTCPPKRQATWWITTDPEGGPAGGPSNLEFIQHHRAAVPTPPRSRLSLSLCCICVPRSR